MMITTALALPSVPRLGQLKPKNIPSLPSLFSELPVRFLIRGNNGNMTYHHQPLQIIFIVAYQINVDIPDLSISRTIFRSYSCLASTTPEKAAMPGVLGVT